MFAPNVVGTANATVAGWGNAGGGATQALMPLLMAALIMFGVGEAFGWRVALLVPGVLMIVVGVLYWKFTQDAPQGNFDDVRAAGQSIGSDKKGGWAVFKQAASNYRVWILFTSYAACFGIEIFIHANIALYYTDKFNFGLKEAGMAAGIFGLLALFARALGGILSDKVAVIKGLDGRTKVLFALILGEGIFLVLFSQMQTPMIAVLMMTIFALFTHMACGATYAWCRLLTVMPWAVWQALLVQAVMWVPLPQAFTQRLCRPSKLLIYLGVLVFVAAFSVIMIRFSSAHKTREQALYDQAVLDRVELEKAQTL